MLVVIGLLLGAVIAGSSRKPATEQAVRTLPVARPAETPSLPPGGAGLAALLILPGLDEWPYPLALEPKARYTEAEAAALRPELGAVDVSELTRRRKVELEAILDAVD